MDANTLRNEFNAAMKSLAEKITNSLPAARDLHTKAGELYEKADGDNKELEKLWKAVGGAEDRLSMMTSELYGHRGEFEALEPLSDYLVQGSGLKNKVEALEKEFQQIKSKLKEHNMNYQTSLKTHAKEDRRDSSSE